MSHMRKKRQLKLNFGPKKEKPTKSADNFSSTGRGFGTCPLCGKSIPHYRLQNHASTCEGSKPPAPKSPRVLPEESSNLWLEPDEEPIPGLFVYYNFISENEEMEIMEEMEKVQPPWRESSFNGKHRGKKWGVQCKLKERCVLPAIHPMPSTFQTILFPKFRQCKALRDQRQEPIQFNEGNAIDYVQRGNDYLKSHVDDRQLSKEPIANLSLLGDCYMTFTSVKDNAKTVKVYLPRRCLQILTQSARYNFAHGIENQDLLNPRRVSLTLRESPLTVNR